MKSLKSKLMAAGAMLMVSVVMLTSASFAWFTVSQTPEVQNVNVTMSTTKNMEIARAGNDLTAPAEVSVSDSGSQTAFGGTVTDFAVATLEIPAAISTDKKNVGSAQYDTTGRTKGLINAVADTNPANGLKYYNADVLGEKGDAKKCAAGYYVWLRTNTAGAVTAKISDVKSAIGASALAATTAANIDKIGVAFRVANLTSDVTAASDGHVASRSAMANQDYVAATKTGDTSFTATIGSLPANEAVLVEIVVFANGDKFVASDVTSDFKIQLGKVTFENAAVGTTAGIGAGSVDPSTT